MEVNLLWSTLVTIFVFRITYLIFKIYTTECIMQKENSMRTLLCIGSGGHTTELLRFAGNLNCNKYQPRLYVLADNDVTSEAKIKQTENGHQNHSFKRIPRARNVNQSFISSIITSIYAAFYTVPIVYTFNPNVILCNGPGTCVPICIIAFLMRCLFILDCRIVFIESICRVRSLSLSGKILEYFADIFVVQWPELRDKCFRAKYYGRLT